MEMENKKSSQQVRAELQVNLLKDRFQRCQDTSMVKFQSLSELLDKIGK